jgi:ribosomal protein S1
MEGVPEHYEVGQPVRGRVTQVAPFGAFVLLEPGVEGLVELSHMTDVDMWTRESVRHPSAYVNVGEELELVVLSIYEGRSQIRLRLKSLR